MFMHHAFLCFPICNTALIRIKESEFNSILVVIEIVLKAEFYKCFGGISNYQILFCFRGGRGYQRSIGTM